MRRHLSLLALGMSLLSPGGALAAQTLPSPTTLALLKDHYRPLLVFAPAPDDSSLLAQFHQLKDDAPGLTRRDVVVIAVPFRTPSPSDLSLTAAEGEAARRRFGVAPQDFTVVLLGKDGGEKLRSMKPVSFSKLQQLIDSMPMRQQEMQDPERR